MQVSLLHSDSRVCPHGLLTSDLSTSHWV